MSNEQSLDSKNPPGQGANSLFYNILYSLFTQITPIVVSIVAIPALISGLGIDRFGVLALGWVFVGYFSLFDLGLGRATTKFVSEYLAKERYDEIPAIIWTSWILLSLLGIIAGIILLALIPFFIGVLLNIPSELQIESRKAFITIACSIPFVIYTAGIRAVLEAYQRFRTIAFIATPASILNYLIPLAALFITQRLDIIILLLVINRTIFTIIFFVVCIKTTPGLVKPRWIDKKLLKPLIQFGGWLTVTNIIGPLMTYLDRFLVGALVSVSAVTYYVTPYEILSKIRVVLNSLMVVLFPTFSNLNALSTESSAKAFHRTVRLLFLVVLPLMTVLIIMAEDILAVWINPDFARISAPVLQWLAFGVLVNSVAQVAYNWIQSIGRSDVTAQFHLVELPIYLLLIWWLAQVYGILGVAIAWVVRVILDTILLVWFVIRSLSPDQRSFTYSFALVFLGSSLYCILLILNSTSNSMLLRFGLTTMTLLIYAGVVWRWFLKNDEKHYILTFVTR